MPTIVDATPRSDSVLRWAAREAALTDARVIALSASGGRGYASSDTDAALLRPLDSWVDSALPPELAALTQRVVVSDQPFDALVKASAEADLLALGMSPHHRPWAPHDLTERLLALATCPVAVVPDEVGPDTGRVVVGVDGSPASLAALRWARQQAERTEAGLIAVAAWHWVPEYGAQPYGPSAKDTEAATLEILTGTLAEVPGVECLRVIDQGHPADVLLDLSRHVDLIVVGYDGTGSPHRHLLGSVSRRVAQRSRCPVVIAHENDEAGAR